jgi:hypothetical protein
MKLINGEYNDLLDHDLPKVSLAGAFKSISQSPYSGTGKSTKPSSSNKSPLEAYNDFPKMDKDESSHRSSFDDSSKNMSIQSDCAKHRHSLTEFMRVDETSGSKLEVGQGLLKESDSDHLSNEEENLIAESTNAIESLFAGHTFFRGSSLLGSLQGKSDDETPVEDDIEVSLGGLYANSRRLRIFQDITTSSANEQDLDCEE